MKPQGPADKIATSAAFEEVNLESVATFRSGEGIRVAQLSEETVEQAVPVYGGNGIAGYTARPNVTQPTIAIGRVGQRCGEVYLTSSPAWITDNALYPVTILRDINIRFLGRALQAANLNASKNRNDLPLITQAILRSIRIHVPPTRCEQEAIADTLSDADALIESLEQLLAKKRQIKRGVMRELLSGERRLPGFTGAWTTKQLKEIGRFLKGNGVTREESATGDLPCVRYGELYTQHENHIRAFYSWISEDVARSATRVRHGDILFAGSGETKQEIGKAAAVITDVEAYAGGDIVILRNEKADPIFLGYALNAPAIIRQKASRGQGDAVVHISARSLAEVEVELPPSNEQCAIATVLCELDEDTFELEAKLRKIQWLKQGMMQALLTGRIRLVGAKRARDL